MKVKLLLNLFDVILIGKPVDINPVHTIVSEIDENFFEWNVQIPVVMFTVIADKLDNRSLRDFMFHVNECKWRRRVESGDTMASNKVNQKC